MLGKEEGVEEGKNKPYLPSAGEAGANEERNKRIEPGKATKTHPAKT